MTAVAIADRFTLAHSASTSGFSFGDPTAASAPSEVLMLETAVRSQFRVVGNIVRLPGAMTPISEVDQADAMSGPVATVLRALAALSLVAAALGVAGAIIPELNVPAALFPIGVIGWCLVGYAGHFLCDSPSD